MARLSAVVGLALCAAPAMAQPGEPSLSLEDALAQAQQASESVTVARSDVERARAGVTAARSGYLPTVNGTASYQRTLRSEFEDISFAPPGMEQEGGETDLPFGQRNNWRLGLVLSQPLFDGFRTPAAIAQAKAGVRVAELGVKATRAQVALAVAQAYYDAALAQRQVEIAEVTLQQAEQTLADTKLNFQQGAAPEFDLVRAEVARDNQSTTLVQFRAQRDVSFVQLRRLVGVPVDRPLTLSTKLEAEDVDQVIASVLRAAGLSQDTQRFVVAQAKESVAAREAGVRVAKADRLPTISASSDFGIVSYERSPFHDDWRTNWTIGVSLSLPIFDGFRRRAQIATSSAELAAARAQLASAQEVSHVEAAQATANVTARLTTLETTKRTVGQAKRAYQIAELRFQQGGSTHLELVDARVQLEQALLNLARSARDVRVARVRQALLPGLPLGAAGGF
ncbi:MAG TPA: TolC family protein [Kofleriaceae bacterium]|nr:TolC family protein [Kofleriaceae bacterium]